ncbi:MAG: nucleotide exchange factor GrpE, partial [Pseudomonadota bacterium]
MADDPKTPTNETPSEHNPGDPKAAAETTKPDDAGPAVDANAEAREAARREAIADAEQEAARLAGDAGEKAPQASTDAQQAPTSDDGSSGSETPLTIAELEGQVADLTDRLLRAHAEVQNLHRRLERDVADSQKYGITKFARDIVT